MILPKKWKCDNLLGRKTCLNGITISSNGYSFFMTDFVSLWYEQLNGQEFLKVAAEEHGLEDLTNEGMVKLLTSIEECFLEKKLSITETDDTLLCSLPGTVSSVFWKFKLVKQSPDKTIEFLAALNYQQFSNHAYLQQQINSLIEIIGVKDTFIRFLVENFKQSHGLELINKYKRMNKEDLHAIEQFNTSRWEKVNANEYRKLRTKRKTNEQEELNNIIKQVAGDQWKFANSFYTAEPEVEEELSPVKIKPESSPVARASAPPPSSPLPAKKKLKIGMLGASTKLSAKPEPTTTTTTTTTPSPKKKRKIGSL
ncbi:hypothetical protein JA1_003175 [Spathaspora sp. JA1]|nr:hypothetical protein JA1_003175 [Spathaspora sp. JA1]